MKNTVLLELHKQLSKQQNENIPAFAPRPVTTPAPKPAEDNVDDATLFARATQGVRRMDSTPPLPRTRRHADANILLRRATATAEEAPGQAVSDTVALMHTVGTEDQLSFARSGISPKILQKLKTGQPHWQAAVDLHGCTVDHAREAVLTLLQEAQREGLQAVKIVHGKGVQNGQPLLKTCVNGWLRQIPEVLAFVSAQPRDGGNGAVCVLLKRRRDDENRSHDHK